MNSKKRGPVSPVLPVLSEHIRREGRPDAAAVKRLAEQLGVPSARVRGVISFFADLHAQPGAVRVCHGTSCLLAGCEQIHGAIASSMPCDKVYCLGYCDRSPAVLRPDGSVVAGLQPNEAASIFKTPVSDPSSVSVRCLLAEPIVTARISRGDHSSLNVARAAGVYEGLAKALERKPAEIIAAMKESGERGRGGAAYPTGEKWRICASAEADTKFVIANGDEGDPGSFIDRILMEQDPHALLEGLAICAYAVGAHEGVVFVRSEYPRAFQRVEQAVSEARSAGLLGQRVMGSDFAFDVTVFRGLGSYVCGEETAMLNAIEGRRGEVRVRPPYPATAGLHGKPTVVDNVETLLNVPWILTRGAEAFAALGTDASPGSKVMCLNWGFRQPGIVEVEFGTSLREVIEVAGGGSRDATPLAAVLLGGPMGNVLQPDAWDLPICYGAMAAQGVRLGHGGIVAVPYGSDFAALLRHWLGFMRDESCGKCVPCAIGSKRALEIAQDSARENALSRLSELCEVIRAGSLCAFGQLIPEAALEIVELLQRPISSGSSQ
jgi:NADH:ubiquinone oxidoreductase subunit F (NADH-binding)/NADH:ubiquinone oxidoreductase subunit E